MALFASVLCAKKRHSPVGARKISVSKVTSVTLDPVASAWTRQRDAGLDGGLPTAAQAGAGRAFSHPSPCWHLEEPEGQVVALEENE